MQQRPQLSAESVGALSRCMLPLTSSLRLCWYECDACTELHTPFGLGLPYRLHTSTVFLYLCHTLPQRS